VLLVGLLLWPAGAVAAPPPNDNFVDATEITGLPAEVTGSNVDATREPDEPTSGDHSIWFRWTAPADGGVTATVGGCSGPFVDTVYASLFVAVFVRSPAFGLVSVPSTFHADVGRVYWIAISSSTNLPGQGLADPDICVRVLPGPANDDFAAATPLTGFPVSASYPTPTEPVGFTPGPTDEPGEPNHFGDPSSPPAGSVWYSWTAPADRRVVLRVCGAFSAVGVYTGNSPDALSWVATRRRRSGSCGELSGASVTLDAVGGEVYRIAVAGPSNFHILIGTQLALLAGQKPTFLYTAFPGQTDNLKLRLTGTEPERALLVEADGVTAANGCHADSTAAGLRCPVPGRSPIGLDIDLGDGNDKADIRVLGPEAKPTDDTPPRRQVDGGDGDDTLVGSAGFYSAAAGWTGALSLVGGPGADRFTGGPGDDSVQGGPGPDRIDPGPGSDRVNGGPGGDRVRAVDGASDSIRCEAGDDHARLDGIDLSGGCERHRLSSPARAVPTSAWLSNDDGLHRLPG
jgi:RTX calcium-binding nonapeptide repeat (4 copies)